MTKIVVLQDVIARFSASSSVPLKAGDEVDVPAHTADTLVRGHYAKRTPGRPPVVKEPAKKPVKKPAPVKRATKPAAKKKPADE